MLYAAGSLTPAPLDSTELESSGAPGPARSVTRAVALPGRPLAPNRSDGPVIQTNVKALVIAGYTSHPDKIAHPTRNELIVRQDSGSASGNDTHNGSSPGLAAV